MPPRHRSCRSSLRRVDAEGCDRQAGANALLGAILERDFGVDLDLVRIRINGVDDVGVFLVDDAAAHLAGSRQLTVVGIELLVEEDEFAQLLGRRQRAIDACDLGAD